MRLVQHRDQKFITFLPGSCFFQKCILQMEVIMFNEIMLSFVLYIFMRSSQPPLEVDRKIEGRKIWNIK